jgi:anti-sigma regulatory factor (Ser/Thr protein kinase)
MYEVARFGARPASISESRRWLARCLEGEIAVPAVQDAQLCTSELAANAIGHAGTAFRVEIRLSDGLLRVTVHDEDPTGPAPRQADRSSVSGRGLLVVEEVSTRWGWARDPAGGKDVWFELDATGSTPAS